MNGFLVYWIAGCIIAGAGVGATMKRCPNAKVEPGELVAVVAVWPALIITAFQAPRMEVPKCDP